MQKILSSALIVLGVIGLVLGYLGESVWAPPSERTASVSLKDPGVAVVVDPGVMYMSAHEGSVSITAGSEVSIIPAPQGDVTAYLGDARYTRITGASDWTTLATETVNADGPADLSGIASADLWRSVTTSSSPATIDIAQFSSEETSEQNLQPYRSVLLVPADPAVGISDISMTWPVDAKSPWVPFAYAGGAAAALVGLILLALSRGRSGGRASTQRSDTPRARGAHTSAPAAAGGASAPVLAGATSAGAATAHAIDADREDAESAPGHVARDEFEPVHSEASPLEEKDDSQVSDSPEPGTDLLPLTDPRGPQPFPSVHDDIPHVEDAGASFTHPSGEPTTDQMPAVTEDADHHVAPVTRGEPRTEILSPVTDSELSEEASLSVDTSPVSRDDAAPNTEEHR